MVYCNYFSVLLTNNGILIFDKKGNFEKRWLYIKVKQLHKRKSWALLDERQGIVRWLSNQI